MTIFSNYFITKAVKATGLKSLNEKREREERFKKIETDREGG